MWQDLDGGATRATGPAVYVYLLFAWVLLPVVRAARDHAARATGPASARDSRASSCSVPSPSAYLAAVAPHRRRLGPCGRQRRPVRRWRVATPTSRPRCTSSRRAARRSARATGPSSGSGSPTSSRSRPSRSSRREGLTSIWCSWAAVVSVLIFFQLVAWRAMPSATDPASFWRRSKGRDLAHR